MRSKCLVQWLVPFCIIKPVTVSPCWILVAKKSEVEKVIFDPPAAIKGLKTSCYGQWKGLKALEYSRLWASGNPEKSRAQIFENPGIGILKKSQDPGTSRDAAGACSWDPQKWLRNLCTTPYCYKKIYLNDYSSFQIFIVMMKWNDEILVKINVKMFFRIPEDAAALRGCSLL